MLCAMKNCFIKILELCIILNGIEYVNQLLCSIVICISLHGSCLIFVWVGYTSILWFILKHSGNVRIRSTMLRCRGYIKIFLLSFLALPCATFLLDAMIENFSHVWFPARMIKLNIELHLSLVYYHHEAING